jgi:hypothetical protein
MNLIKKRYFLAFLVIAPTIICAEPVNHQRKDLGLTFGLGVSEGTDYSKAIRNYLSNDVSGFLSFLNFELGVEFRVVANLYLYPRIQWEYNQISIPIKGFEAVSPYKINSILLPGVSGKYFFAAGSRGAFYVSGNLGYPFPYSDFSGFSFKSKGIETGLAAGFEFTLGFEPMTRRLGIETGFSRLPVTVKFNDKIEPAYKNFGGFFVNLIANFPITKY